jgi:hypothetical protein
VAGLVIGDRALALGEDHPHRLDLAAEWRAWTGMAAVFAVWAGRPDLDPSVVEHVRAAGLRGAADVAAGRLPPGLSGAQERYLRENIRYQLDDRATMGLMRFAALARRAGLAVREHWSLYAPARPPVVDDSDVHADLNDASLGLPLPPAALLRLLERARLPELLAAADARRAALHPQGATSALRGETQAGGPVEVERDLTDPLDGIPAGPLRLRLRLPAAAAAGAVADALAGLAGLGERLASVTLLPPAAGARPAAGGAAVDGSATAYLRVLALLRLALPALPHVVGAHEAYGRGLAQVACRGGADDIGVVMAHSEAHRMEDGVWPMTDREAERCLRQAGLEPARRDAAFRRLGGALTTAEAAGPLRRLDASR